MTTDDFYFLNSIIFVTFRLLYFWFP